MLAEYDACENAADRAAVIRKHAIYRSHLANWRKQLTNVDPPKKRGRRANPFSRVSSQISNRLARIAVASLHGTTPSIGIRELPCSHPRTYTAEEAKNADSSAAPFFTQLTRATQSDSSTARRNRRRSNQPSSSTRPTRSRFFCDDLLKHLPIEAQIGNELLELHIFFSKLPQLADLGRPEAAVFLFPEVERVFVDAKFSDDIYDRRAGFSLA